MKQEQEQKQKQIVRVLKAVEKGYATSTEIAALTRLSVQACSQHLAQLVKCGAVEVTGTTGHARGRPLNVHLLVQRENGENAPPASS